MNVKKMMIIAGVLCLVGVRAQFARAGAADDAAAQIVAGYEGSSVFEKLSGMFISEDSREASAGDLLGWHEGKIVLSGQPDSVVSAFIKAKTNEEDKLQVKLGDGIGSSSDILSLDINQAVALNEAIEQLPWADVVFPGAKITDGKCQAEFRMYEDLVVARQECLDEIVSFSYFYPEK